MKRTAVWAGWLLCLCPIPALRAQALPFYPAPGSPFSSGTPPGFFNTGDFNGDANPDMLIGTALMLGDGHGKFTRLPGPSFPKVGSVIVADFNNDGRSDVVVVSPTSFNLYLGNSDGTLTLTRPNISNISALYAVGD